MATGKKKRKPLERYVKVRYYSAVLGEPERCDVWIMAKDGSAHYHLLHGDLLLNAAEELLDWLEGLERK